MTKHILFLFSLLLLVACKKEQKQAITLCTSQFDSGVDLHIKYYVSEKGKRSFVYRSEGDKAFEMVKEINASDIKGDSILAIDSTLKFSGNYSYKVSYGEVLSPATTVNFTKGATTLYIPNTVKDTLTIKSDYNCSTYSFALYNRWGQMIINQQNLSGNQSFDVSKQPSGTYVCLVYVANREINNIIAITH